MRIAITGGIGSGKSHICAALARRGISVYDCDRAAKRLMRTSEDIRRELISLIGSCAYETDGTLNKAAVAAFLLQSEANSRALNAIVHPAVAEDFRASGMQWMECAILFESGFDRLVDSKVCVAAPLETRISRIMLRDGITRDKAIEWINHQMPQEEVAQRCNFVINNDGTTDIDSQITQLLTLCS